MNEGEILILKLHLRLAESETLGVGLAMCALTKPYRGLCCSLQFELHWSRDSGYEGHVYKIHIKLGSRVCLTRVFSEYPYLQERDTHFTSAVCVNFQMERTGYNLHRPLGSWKLRLFVSKELWYNSGRSVHSGS